MATISIPIKSGTRQMYDTCQISSAILGRLKWQNVTVDIAGDKGFIRGTMANGARFDYASEELRNLIVDMDTGRLTDDAVLVVEESEGKAWVA